MLGDETLLAQTRRRISPLFDSDRMITVVTKRHEEFYSRELNKWPHATVVAQPENRGTGVALATAILMLRELDADAIVAAFPCDHYYRNERAFLDVIEAGILIARDNSDSIVLLGAEATCPETEYGWIEPARAFPNGVSFAPARVRHFWEKPAPATAQDLLRRGCLWNTFVTVGRVTAFIDVLCHVAANSMLRLGAGIIENDLDSAYRSIPPIDFSRDVLASRPERLLVIRDAASGWTDLGNPKRVFDTLARERIAPAWLESIPGVEIPVASQQWNRNPHASEVNMTDWPFAEEVEEVVVQLFHKDNTYEIEEWITLTPIELGVLSWYLGNFYY
jgi:mannose-1-phosphate guanylyltransferase